MSVFFLWLAIIFAVRGMLHFESERGRRWMTRCGYCLIACVGCIPFDLFLLWVFRRC